MGEQHFEAIPDTPNWHNVVPRIGGAYDLFGNGKTAVKGNWGIYMSGQGPGFVQNYNPSFPALDTRTWTDLNRDDIAQENEIGPGSTTFGVRRNQNLDPDVKRPYQHLWDVGIQHEVRPGFGAVGHLRAAEHLPGSVDGQPGDRAQRLYPADRARPARQRPDAAGLQPARRTSSDWSTSWIPTRR